MFWFIIELNVQQVHISCHSVSESERCKIKIINVFKGHRKIMVKQKTSRHKIGNYEMNLAPVFDKNKVFMSLDTGVKLN